MAIAYTVENRKGGVGKTTTTITAAVLLARRIRERGGKVLVVDMDPQGDVARGLGLKTEGKCISDVLLGRGSLDELRANVISADRSASGGPERPNLFVIPASDRLSDAKEDIISEFALLAARSLRGRGNGTRHLKHVLDEKLGLVKKAFDYVLLDCPPTLDLLQQAIHQFADYAIVPVKMDFHGTSATGRHTGNIVADQAAGIDIDIAVILPTMVDSRLNLTKSMTSSLIRVYGEKVIADPIPNTIRVAEAPAHGGLTIVEYMPEHPAAAAYEKFTDRIYKE